ncbi:MAG TPA: Dabb family protein [Fibrobacteria bacterium]|jgi:hypothetical protein|nr:Dabb family protein [Fibrobacteria bacterium]
MFVHSVYFWLKPDLTAEQVREFEARGRALITIPTIRHGWFGTPADTDRPVIDRTYTYGMVTVFDDAAGHDAYQVHEIHQRFLELKDFWTQVKIYDFT